MVNGASTTTWEEETLARLRYGKGKQKEAEQELAFWSQYSSALEKALELDRQHRGIKVGEQKSTIDPERLRTQSVCKSLMEIAAANNGLLVTKDALDILVEGKVFVDREHARGNLYSTIYHNKKYFQREREGVYRLVSPAEIKLSLNV